jgi:hypothetical protein
MPPGPFERGFERGEVTLGDILIGDDDALCCAEPAIDEFGCTLKQSRADQHVVRTPAENDGNRHCAGRERSAGHSGLARTIRVHQDCLASPCASER